MPHALTWASLDVVQQQQEPPDKRQRRAVARPGVPLPTRLSSFVVPNRPSPPLRGPDKDGHFVFDLGDNISSRCALGAPPWPSASLQLGGEMRRWALQRHPAAFHPVSGRGHCSPSGDCS